MAEFYHFFVHVACGRGVVLLYGIVIRYVLSVLWMTSLSC